MTHLPDSLVPGLARLSRNAMNSRGGCQCKLAGLDLEDLLRRTGFSGDRQDCAVFSQKSGTYLTTHCFTGVGGVDLKTAGRDLVQRVVQEATSSRGVPQAALITIVIDPELPWNAGTDVLNGIRSECTTYGVEILGGHTATGPEMMAGLTLMASVSEKQISRIDRDTCGVFLSNCGPLLCTTDLTPTAGTDLFSAGRIAAYHSMNDLYASGGVPKWALATLVTQVNQPREFGEAVMGGIRAACAEVGVELLGGHCVSGPEMMAGLAVIGVPSSDRILRKGGARPGDCLLLSKPLGVGLVLRGYKLGLLHETDLQQAIGLMESSNAQAASSALACGVHASTDVSGFGLLGHLSEMLPKPLGATLRLGQIPVMRSARILPSQAKHSIWISNNLDYASANVPISTRCTTEDLAGLLDPQTNGGLLVAADAEALDRLAHLGFVDIGRVTAAGVIEILD